MNFDKFSWKTEEESFEEEKEAKIVQLTQACQEAIYHGFFVEIDGTNYRISYDAEAQTNISERWLLFQNRIIEDITITVHEQPSDEHTRITVTKDQFEQIYLASIEQKEAKIARLRDRLIPQVYEARTESDLEYIDWGNIHVYPEDPTVILDSSYTLDKQLEGKERRLNQAKQELDSTNTALIELTLHTFMGMF